MSSIRSFHWIPYLLLVLSTPAAAAPPLERITLLERQVGELRDLQEDLVPLISRIDSRLQSLEQDRSRSLADRQELDSLRRTIGELTRQQQQTEARLAPLESEIRRLKSPPVPTTPSAAPPRPSPSAASPFERQKLTPRLFPAPARSPLASPDSAGAIRDEEFWQYQKEAARRRLIASRRANGLDG